MIATRISPTQAVRKEVKAPGTLGKAPVYTKAKVMKRLISGGKPGIRGRGRAACRRVWDHYPHRRLDMDAVGHSDVGDQWRCDHHLGNRD